jgi:hypothetical protein
MKNHWMKKHLNRNHLEQSIRDNYAPIALAWESIDNTATMPVIRENYMKYQSEWSIYVVELELERMKSYGRSYSQIR